MPGARPPQPCVVSPFAQQLDGHLSWSTARRRGEKAPTTRSVSGRDHSDFRQFTAARREKYYPPTTWSARVKVGPGDPAMREAPRPYNDVAGTQEPANRAAQCDRRQDTDHRKKAPSAAVHRGSRGGPADQMRDPGCRFCTPGVGYASAVLPAVARRRCSSSRAHAVSGTRRTTGEPGISTAGRRPVCATDAGTPSLTAAHRRELT